MSKDVTFESLNLHPSILRAIEESGYTTATPIQAQAIPEVMAGHDLMASAQTGTGKTAAFALPALNLLATPHESKSRGPRILVLVPTRELAAQVNEAARKYGKFIRARTVSIVGGMPYPLQNKLLSQPLDILVATPGRLIDHMDRGRIDMSRLQMLILDEADRMLDMGFMPDLKRILALLPKQRQNLMFSATFSTEIKKLSEEFLKDPVLVEVARSNATNENVTQKVYHVAQDDKHALLAQILNETETKQVIVFTKTKLTASRLARQLVREGISADAIHGDKSQAERIQALDAFKQGKINALIATDVAARGLDIDQLPMVINYEIPSAPEDYVHRIGRTGRAGALGIAISLVSPDEEKYLKEIEKLIKREITKETSNLPVRGSRLVSDHKPREKSYDRAASTPRPSPTKKSSDPWFDKPYEPTGTGAVKPQNNQL
ncbi:MAG: DEAD/DEAH box helicase, partial [Methylophilaceae bacterium]|nr:DEAD/DEAH box helicase [Methylophilaceae bacterium]